MIRFKLGFNHFVSLVEKNCCSICPEMYRKFHSNGKRSLFIASQTSIWKNLYCVGQGMQEDPSRFLQPVIAPILQLLFTLEYRKWELTDNNVNLILKLYFSKDLM